MSKRFTDTEKWKDPWFRELPPSLKALWLFFTDNCDQAGFWKKDYKLAAFFMNCPVHEEEFMHVFNNEKTRLKDHGTHLEILDFVSFQFGHLSPDCRPHRPIIELLKKYEKKGYWKGTNTLEEKEKEQEKEQEKEKERGGSGGRPSLEDCQGYFLELGIPQEAEKFFDYFSANGWKVGGKTPMRDWKAAARNWQRNSKAFTKTDKKYRTMADVKETYDEIMREIKA